VGVMPLAIVSWSARAPAAITPQRRVEGGFKAYALQYDTPVLNMLPTRATKW